MSNYIKRLLCDCPAHCKYCGARRKRDFVGHLCGSRNCQWEYGFETCKPKETDPKAKQDKGGRK